MLLLSTADVNKKYELRDGRWRCKRLLFCCTKKFCVLAFKRIQNFPPAHIVCKRWRRSIAKSPTSWPCRCANYFGVSNKFAG